MPPLRDVLLESVDAGGRAPLPGWWLAFLGVFCFVPAVTNSMLLPLMLPPAIAEMVGDSRKAAALGLLTTTQFSVSLAMPLLGTLSDKCTGAFGRRFGRRRPFVVVGCVLSTTGAVLLKLSDSFPTVVVGFAVLIAGNVCSWVPYMTVLPEVVPPSQRGVAASFQMVVDSLSWASGSGLGVLLGEKLISVGQTYDLIIVLNILQLPIGIATMGEGPGWCSPELPPPATPDDRASWIAESSSITDYRRAAAERSSSRQLGAAEEEGLRLDIRRAQRSGIDYRRYRDDAGAAAGADGGVGDHALRKMWTEGERAEVCGEGCCGRLAASVWAAVADFFSAFTNSRAFTLLWLYGSIGYVGSLLVGTWMFYWYQDELEPRGYEIFGHHITNSTQTAISINGVISRVAVVSFALPGGLLGDKFGRLAVIRVTAILTTVIPPLLYAFLPSFTMTMLLAVVGGAVQGLGSPCAAALNADVLPADSDNAGRDMQLISATPSILPGLLIPVLVGNALAWFPSHAVACEPLQHSSQPQEPLDQQHGYCSVPISYL
jgi:MFS family permease